MSDSTTTTTPAGQPHDATAGAGMSPHPTDILLNLIVLLLAPIFLDASGGNIAFARMAALETVNAYRARHNADLIAIAQIIAYGLAALGSLSLSMADDISLSMTLRLRGNANALNRCAEQNRRAIRQTNSPIPLHPMNATAETSEDQLDDERFVAEVTAKVATIQKQATATPAAQPPQPKSATIPPTTDRQHQAMWAAAMANVAAEVTASLPNLPPAERRVASIRAAALSSTASDLLSGNVPARPRPGDLNVIRPPAA